MSEYLRAYGPREDSHYAGLNEDFGRRLTAMLQAAPDHVRRPGLFESLSRDDEAQRRAINSVAQRLYGRPATIMEYSRGIPGYAAPVGGSRHQSGEAADLNWSRLQPEGREWLRSNAGAYGLRFPLPDTDAGHLEYDANWQGQLPNAPRASVSQLPTAPPPIMNSALIGLSATRPAPETSMPPIFSGAMRGFRDGGAVEAALRIAARGTDKNPTDAQKESGRYAKGTFSWNSLKIAIENPKGSVRSGTDKNGKRWECTLPATYGFVRGTEAVDGDAVDCYVGPDHDSSKVFVIDQVDAKTKAYDEPKCMLSYPNKAAAVADYRKAFSDGKADDRIGAVTEMSVADFKTWVRSPQSRKPVGKFANGGTVMSKNNAISTALDVARRAMGGRVGYADGGEPLSTMDWTPETERGIAPRGPVARSANTPLGDLAARAFDATPIEELLARYVPGSLASEVFRRENVGPFVSGTEEVAGDVALQTTGIPNAQSAGRAFAEGNIGRGLGHAGLAIGTPLATLYGAGVLPRALQRAAPGVLGIGVASALSEDVLGASPAEAQQNRNTKAPPPAPAPTTPAPTTLTGAPTDRAAEVIANDPVLKSLRAQIDAAKKIANSHPSEQVQSNRARANEQLVTLNKEYNERVGKLTAGYQPFDQAFPFMAQYRTPIGILAPAAAAWATKSLGNAASRGNMAPWNRAVTDADRAFHRGDDIAFAYNAERAGRHLANEPTGLVPRAGRAAGDFTRDTGLPVLAGATVGGELYMMPHQHNSINAPPGSSARTEAETALNNFWSTALPGIVMGGLGGATGSHVLPSGRPGYRPIAESRQLQNMVEGGTRSPTSISSGPSPLPSLAPPAARDVPELMPPAGGNARAGRLLENREAGRPYLGLATEESAALAAPRAGQSLLPAPLPNLPSAPANSNNPQILTRIRDSRGRTHLQNETGNFAVNPRSMRQQRLRERERGKKKGDDDNPSDESGRKSGGMVQAALEIARRFMGGRTGYEQGGEVTQASVAVGPILGPTGGREDAKPVSVESGSYVLPADFVSGIGTGNTIAGHQMIEQVFGKSDVARATGGPVPILISDGEHVLTREQVEQVGGGDYEKGCRILDALVKKQRAQTIQTLKGLPGPAQG